MGKQRPDVESSAQLQGRHLAHGTAPKTAPDAGNGATFKDGSLTTPEMPYNAGNAGTAPAMPDNAILPPRSESLAFLKSVGMR